MRSKFWATRRRVLQVLAATCGAASIMSPATAALRGTQLADSRISRAIDALISHRDSAAVIGMLYLRQFGQERSIGVLEAKLQQDLRDGVWLDEYALLDRIKTDFERGNIVRVQGWLLSRTEARLCALCASYDNPDARWKFG